MDDIGDLLETIGDIGTNLPSDNPRDSKSKRVFKNIVKIPGVLMIITLGIIYIWYLLAEKT